MTEDGLGSSSERPKEQDDAKVLFCCASV